MSFLLFKVCHCCFCFVCPCFSFAPKLSNNFPLHYLFLFLFCFFFSAIVFFLFVMFEVEHTRFLLYLHFTQVAGKCTIKKNNDDQIARSRSVQAIQFVFVLMMLREFLVSWQLNFFFFNMPIMRKIFFFLIPAPSYEFCTILEKYLHSFLRQRKRKYRICFSWHLDFFRVCFNRCSRWLTWSNSNSSPSLTPGILVLPWHIVGYVEMCVPNKHSSKLVHIPITNIANISWKN